MASAYAQLRADLAESPAVLAARLDAVGACLTMADIATSDRSAEQLTVSRTTGDGWAVLAPRPGAHRLRRRGDQRRVSSGRNRDTDKAVCACSEHSEPDGSASEHVVAAQRRRPGGRRHPGGALGQWGGAAVSMGSAAASIRGRRVCRAAGFRHVPAAWAFGRLAAARCLATSDGDVAETYAGLSH